MEMPYYPLWREQCSITTKMIGKRRWRLSIDIFSKTFNGTFKNFSKLDKIFFHKNNMIVKIAQKIFHKITMFFFNSAIF